MVYWYGQVGQAAKRLRFENLMEQKSEAARKSSQAAAAENSFDLPLYLLVEGTAKNVWAMSTVADGLLINLVPVCTSEEQALELVNNLQSRTYQYAELSLSKIEALFEGREVRFILDPKSEERSGVLILKEGPNWGLSSNQLSNLLTEPSKKSGRK